MVQYQLKWSPLCPWVSPPPGCSRQVVHFAVICRHYSQLLVSQTEKLVPHKEKCYTFVHVRGVDVQLALEAPDHVDSSCCFLKPLWVVHHMGNYLRNVKHFNGLRSGVDDAFHLTRKKIWHTVSLMCCTFVYFCVDNSVVKYTVENTSFQKISNSQLKWHTKSHFDWNWLRYDLIMFNHTIFFFIIGFESAPGWCWTF